MVQNAATVEELSTAYYNLTQNFKEPAFNTSKIPQVFNTKKWSQAPEFSWKKASGLCFTCDTHTVPFISPMGTDL